MTGPSRSDRELWKRADAELDHLLDLAPEHRMAALEQRNLDGELEVEVRKLLRAAENEGPLDRSLGQLVPGGAVADEVAPDLGGRRFGPFELEHEIGRGGMSVVYQARRAGGEFDQLVALKILTVGHLASRDRIRREKEILARLRHAHIATFVDGGVADDGTPWIAMELVEGEPLDRYCETAGLEVREIVELFCDACDAVAYAHRNLVVHRDLKPGNIMVDRHGQLRLLDFGIAKLLDELDDPDDPHPPTRVFTPRYAAPEQFSGDPVTTATDVFGMGAVLYQLLTGTPPRSDAEGAPAAAATGPSVPRPSRVPGVRQGIDRDLDTVILKALRPEPERRYPSAAELGDDLRRWLARRPVRAVPDSTGYRVRKLVQRHRTLVGGAALLSLAILAGIVATWWQAQRARVQAEVASREAERATAVTDFLLDLFSFAEPDRSQGELLTVRETLDVGARQLEARLADQPQVRVELLTTVGEIYRRLGLYDEAVPLLDTAVALGDELGGDARTRARLRRATLALSRFELDAAEADIEEALADPDPRGRVVALQALGSLRRGQGRLEDSAAAFEEALSLAARLEDPDLARTAELHLSLADTFFGSGDLDRAEELYLEALDEVRTAHKGDHTETALVLQSLGVLASEQGDADGALGYLEEALAMRERLLGENHPDVAVTLGHIAQVHRAAGRFDEAEEGYRRALELQQRRLGPDHPAVLSSLNSLALLAYDRGRVEEGAEILDDVVARARRAYGDVHPVLADFLVNLAAMRRVLMDFDAAEAHLTEALAINRKTVGVDTVAVGHCYAHLGNLARAREELAKAEESYRQALAAIRAAVGEAHPETLSVQANLAGVAFERHRYAESASQFGGAFTVAAATLAEGHPIRVLIEARFARSLVWAGRSDEGLLHAERAANAASTAYPPGHPRRLEIDAVLGGALIAAGRDSEGRSLLRDVRDRLAAGGTSTAAHDEVVRWLDGSPGASE